MPLFGKKKQEEKQEQVPDQDQATLAEQLRRLMGLEGGIAPAAPGVISNVDISKLIEYIISEKAETPIAEELESKKDIEELLSIVEKMSRDYTDIYARDGIARIYHPVYGSVHVDARLGSVAILLGRSIRILWNRVRRLINENAPPEDVYKAAKEAELFTKLSYLVLVEIYSKLINMYFINAPPKARPPLVNVALGYEILDTETTLGRQKR